MKSNAHGSECFVNSGPPRIIRCSGRHSTERLLLINSKTHSRTFNKNTQIWTVQKIKVCY